MSEPLSDSALDQLFRTARTYNGYLDKPVSEDQLRAIWDLVKYGPTSANSLPARIVWCVSDEAKQKLAALAMPANGEKILSAPVTAIIGMDTEFFEHLPELFPHTDARSWFAGRPEPVLETVALRNGSLQGAYLILAARALGLDAGPQSGFDAAAVDKAFFPDGRYRSNFIVNLGVADHSKTFARGPRLAFEDVAEIV